LGGGEVGGAKSLVVLGEEIEKERMGAYAEAVGGGECGREVAAAVGKPTGQGGDEGGALISRQVI
jgi:hypothetical protein